MQSEYRTLRHALTVLAFAATMLCGTSAEAQQFKIESEIYQGDSQAVVSRNVTLFDDGLVYDFRYDGADTETIAEMTVYDSRTKTISLLDPTRRVCLDMTDLKLMQMVSGVQKETAQNESMEFLVNETWTEEHDWGGDWVKLSSDTVTYRMQGKRPQKTEFFPLYVEFLDNFTRVAVSDPRRLPPFSRLRLNATIKQLTWIPVEVRLEMKPNPLVRNGLSATSKHTLIPALSERDRRQILEAKASWTAFERVKLVEYRELGKHAPAHASVAELESATISK